MSILNSADLVNRVIQKLNELTAVTDIGNLHKGDGTGDVMSNAVGIELALNNSKNARFRQVLSYVGYFTTSWVSGQAWAPYDGTGSSPAFAAATHGSDQDTDTGAILWWARNVYWAGSALTFVDEASLAIYDPGYLNTTTVNNTTPPSCYYRRGRQGVGVYPVPLGAATVSADGFAVPPDMADAGTVDWLTPVIIQLLVSDASVEMCVKNSTNVSIASKVGSVSAEARELAITAWKDLPLALRMAGGPFGVPPEGYSQARNAGQG